MYGWMEATIMGYIGVILGNIGSYRGNGKENGNYYSSIGYTWRFVSCPYSACL